MEVTVDEISSPGDLKDVPREKLNELAKSCREKLIDIVSETGGHFGPNLGVVELTVALHYVFDSPEDRLVWDVGHQGYIHKMLTGRLDEMDTIRQRGGLSGFLKRSESKHDIFNAGHASTSISAASGIAAAEAGTDNDVLAIIGDGSLTGGMTYEGLNNAGGEELDMVVVLNDNGMAIAENVGAITEYFDRLIHLPAYEQMKSEVKKVLKRGPEQLGRKAAALARRFEMSLKNLVIPRLMFEEFGFRYFGPVDGHDTDKLLDEFEKVKRYDGPRFVHVLTEKGHGYEPAAEDHYASHAVKPFDVETGESLEPDTRPKWSQRLGDTLVELGGDHPDLNVITAAMRKGTRTVEFANEFPDRFYDVGIAEQHAVTFAGGLAVEGKKPAVCIYSTFLQRAYDQVFHDVCLMDLPVKFFLDRAGLVGGDGETHQGIFDLAYLRSLPGIAVGAPSTDRQLQDFVKTALEYDDGPIAVRYPRALVETSEPLPAGELEYIPPGKGERVVEGSDVSVVTLGPFVTQAREAASRLADEGIDVEVINARWVAPLDRELILDSVCKTGAAVTLEEGILEGGFGSAVLELLAESGNHLPVSRLGIPEGDVGHGDRQQFLGEFGLDSAGVVKTVRDLLSDIEK